MKITAIERQEKRRERVSVFVDEKYSFSLTLSQLADSGLKRGDELSDKKIAEFKKLSETGKLEGLALNWALRRHHSQKEIKDYLARKTEDESLREGVLASLEAAGFIDDQRFAQEWVASRRRRGYSSYVIRGELRKKGVEAEIIDAAIESGPDQIETLKAFIESKQLKKRYPDNNKLMAYLASRGYYYGDIKQALED